MIQQERLLSVLKAPHISEKATNNAEGSNTIVFKVALDANKVEIANAVEQLFEVKVDSVRTVVVKGKTKRRGSKMSRHLEHHALIITASLDENLFLAARNLYKVDVRDVQGIDPVSLIAFDKVVVTVDAVKQIEEMLA